MNSSAARYVPNGSQRAWLDLAAKAGAIQCRWSAEEGFIRYDTQKAWNPFESWDDCMELASKLFILFTVDNNGACAYRGDVKFEEKDADVYRALRIAIVRFAVELGKQCG